MSKAGRANIWASISYATVALLLVADFSLTECGLDIYAPVSGLVSVIGTWILFVLVTIVFLGRLIEL